MAIFDIGETVICSVEVRNDSGALVDPNTSMTVKINKTRPSLSNILTATNMVKDSTGKYHYDFQTATQSAGDYQAVYIATDGTRISIESEPFTLKE